MNKHFLTLSEKSKYMIFDLKGDNKCDIALQYHEIECNPNVKCQCIEIKEVKYYKYLGHDR